jgi:antitoxin component YwqK of YwqJK toxin-antitoxin module
MKTFIFIIASFVMILGNAFAVATPDNRYFFQDDPLNGPKKEYYPNGKVSKAYILDNGRINGSYKFYSEKGVLVSDQLYKDGIPNGYFRTYYESGQLKSEMNMKAGGDITGLSREFYEDGTLKSESNVSGQAPEFTSQIKEYRPNGQLQKEAAFSQGKFVYSISYDQQGRVVSEDKPGQSISYWYEENSKRHVSINGVPQD